MLHYYDLLEPDGIVVIDAAYKGKRETLHVIMNSVWMQLAKKIYWYAESSTYRKMKGIYKRSKVLQEHFDEVFIDDGHYSIAFYRRKVRE